MPGKFEAPRGRKKSRWLLPVFIILLLALLAFAAVWFLKQEKRTPEETLPTVGITAAPTLPAETETLPPETTMPEPEHVVSTATVSATGDILMHKPIITAGAQGSGTYNFDFIFQYLKEYSEATDYAIANLETTLAGTAKPYQGNPLFNCPDEIVGAAKNAGFDMLLTANNHSMDTGKDGYLRTLEVVREAGLETLGTMLSAEDPRYAIQDINGIRVGMICYTYDTSSSTGGKLSLNGNPMTGLTRDNINCYNPDNPESMYDEVEQYLEEMRDAGVEATIMFIHWGPQEYALTPLDAHTQIAQKFCDMGIDVVIGGHPHVVQPMDLLTSSVDPEHKTVVLYSMGNAVSNQRLGNISRVKTAHTEDGVWISVTFSKYSDGTVYVDSVDLMPTWVYLNQKYYILPLDQEKEDQWGSLFGISDSTVNAAKDSYQRTMDLVGEGLKKCQDYLTQSREQREADYLAAVLPDAA